MAERAIDAELAALLWVLAESGTPLVVAAEVTVEAEEFRHAMAEVAMVGGGLANAGLADGGLPGRALGAARSLEDVINATVGQGHVGDLPDAARDLGVVVVLGREDPGRAAHVISAHYVRPIERDGAGHIQRRPPGLLAAWNGDSQRLDHFDWGISDELATRARMETGDFERLHLSRTRLLNELAAAGVLDRHELRAQVKRAALAELGARAEPPSRPDARN